MSLRRRFYIEETKKELVGSRITAYHCGRDIGSGKFSLRFMGTGEGYHRAPLGPGIYFATDENIARLYCKYLRDPFFYKVSIPTDGLYNHVWGTPVELRNSIADLFERESRARGWRDTYSHYVLQLADMMGALPAVKALVKAGVKGVWTNLPAGGEEIAVFDPQIVKIIHKERVG